MCETCILVHVEGGGGVSMPAMRCHCPTRKPIYRQKWIATAIVPRQYAVIHTLISVANPMDCMNKRGRLGPYREETDSQPQPRALDWKK